MQFLQVAIASMSWQRPSLVNLRVISHLIYNGFANSWLPISVFSFELRTCNFDKRSHVTYSHTLCKLQNGPDIPLW